VYNSRVLFYDAAGTLQGEWGTGGYGSKGEGNGKLTAPRAVAVAPNGTVYVADFLDRVQYFAPDGTYRGQWGGSGSGPGQFDFPLALAVGPDGTVYVADISNRIQYFDAAGSYLGEWGGPGHGQGQFVSPTGVTVSPDGRTVYVADAGNGRIQAFCVNPSGKTAQQPATPGVGTPVSRDRLATPVETAVKAG
jgi:DNA-binding beta-propeller fold protein YncE